MSNLGNKEVFARNLNMYIKESGKDRKELAKIWGFPYSTVTEWINAKKYPRMDRIEIMADYFGILKSDLIEDRKEQEKNNDILANIIVRLRVDNEFFDVVESLYGLDNEKLIGVKNMLNAFLK